MAAGPNALRGSGPNPSHAFKYALTQAGSPDPRNDRICITSSCPRQLVLPLLLCHATVNNFGSLYLSPWTMMAQAIRAILLARATAATLIGRRSMMRVSHSRFVPCCLAYRMTAIAPTTSNHRKYRFPCFEIPPSRSLPPVECCLGTRPIQAARLRPDENTFQSPTSATRALATIGPTPGISSSRRLSSLDRCQAWMRFSMVPISAVTFTYWRARTSRLNRAAAGMRSSSWSAIISNSPAVPLRPLAEMMPSSASARGSHSTAWFVDEREADDRGAASGLTAVVRIFLVQNASTVVLPLRRSLLHHWRHSCRA